MNEEASFAYDVFISYSHQDEGWVTSTLLPRLEEAGLRVDDVIVKLDGYRVSGIEELAYHISVGEVGEMVDLEFARNGELIRRQARLMERP